MSSSTPVPAADAAGPAGFRTADVSGSAIPSRSADADVIVVGGGPGGAAVSYYLAQAGLDVLVLEKTSYPRDKVCGDGLTPRSVSALLEMGVETRAEDGWLRNDGLRVLGGGLRLELPWPDLADFPGYGLTRTRSDLDEILVRRAQQAGARLQELCNVTGALTDTDGRVVGVQAEVGPDARPTTYRAAVVVAADGVSARLAASLGIGKREDRPMGVAVRRYYRSPRHADNYLESWLELRDSTTGGAALLPGYGWIFGIGDGTSNVGLGVLNSSVAYGRSNYRTMLTRWLDGLPEDWGFTEANATGPIRGGGLPMGMNRTPAYANGLLLIGDAAGVVNPFNGEGIAYAIESGQLAAEAIVPALARPEGPARERALAAYPAALSAGYGGYYRLGGVFVKLIGHPSVMRLCTRHGLPHPVLMKFILKLLANLTDQRDGDAFDRIIGALTRLTPAL